MGLRVNGLSGPQEHRFVRLANEHGMAVGLGEKRDGAQRGAVLLIEFPGCMDKAHGGFSAIHDRHARNSRCMAILQQIIRAR